MMCINKQPYDGRQRVIVLTICLLRRDVLATTSNNANGRRVMLSPCQLPIPAADTRHDADMPTANVTTY